jgi:hypothetical protein
MRWTRGLRLTSVAQADGEVVWFWRPDAGAKFLRSKLLRSDGGKKARSPRRARRKPLKPLRREGRIASAEPVCSCAHFYVHLAHETAGAARTRLSLHPPLIARVQDDAKLGRFPPRECGPIPLTLFEKSNKRMPSLLAAVQLAGAHRFTGSRVTSVEIKSPLLASAGGRLSPSRCFRRRRRTDRDHRTRALRCLRQAAYRASP